MRYFINFFSAAGIALLIATFAQAETIPPKDAAHYVGDSMTVEGVVSQVSTGSGGTTFINFGGRYPNHVFYAVIFRKNSARFEEVHALDGKTIAISGIVKLYKGKPQIILYSPEQIELK